MATKKTTAKALKPLFNSVYSEASKAATSPYPDPGVEFAGYSKDIISDKVNLHRQILHPALDPLVFMGATDSIDLPRYSTHYFYCTSITVTIPQCHISVPGRLKISSSDSIAHGEDKFILWIDYQDATTSTTQIQFDPPLLFDKRYMVVSTDTLAVAIPNNIGITPYGYLEEKK